MTEATRITIDNIERMIEKIAETEYRRGYADGLNEKRLTEKHWSIDYKAMVEELKERIRDFDDNDLYKVKYIRQIIEDKTKHWKQADIMDLLHDSWKERIKEREDKTE